MRLLILRPPSLRELSELKKTKGKGGEMMGSYSLKTFYEKEYEPQLHKTFQSAVITFLEREFPHLTGPLTRQTFVGGLRGDCRAILSLGEPS